MATCAKCGRVVVDGSTDFGGPMGRSVVLAPTCSGIEVRVAGEVLTVVSADELRHFLARAYGDPVPS